MIIGTSNPHGFEAELTASAFYLRLPCFRFEMYVYRPNLERPNGPFFASWPTCDGHTFQAGWLEVVTNRTDLAPTRGSSVGSPGIG